MQVRNVILKKHFERCGFDEKFFEVYENEAADSMQNIGEMCERLHEACLNRYRTVIYSDFDADGIMSAVIARAGLSEMGFETGLFIPDTTQGYGFSVKDIDGITERFPDTKVILTADVGITCNEAIGYAGEKGITVLVTDHHANTEPCIADVSVDPNQLGETFSHNYVCGSYVVYSVLKAYAEKYCTNEIQECIGRLSLFVGIAVIADLMPLLYENRQLVRDSISAMKRIFTDKGRFSPEGVSEDYRQAFIGIDRLIGYFRNNVYRLNQESDVNENFLKRSLVPFLNSCKRMDGDMSRVYDIFFSSSNVRAAEGIEYIEELNNERRELTNMYYERISDEKKKNADENAGYMQCGLYITDAPAGLLGALCVKFMGMTGLPVIVLREEPDGTFIGSGRSPEWFDYMTEINEYGLSLTCTGHKEAFGVYAENRKAFEGYPDFYFKAVKPQYDAHMSEKEAVGTAVTIAYGSCCECDFGYDLPLIREYMEEAELFRPYGQRFPEPVTELCIAVPDYYVREKLFGRNERHIKLILKDGTEIILINLAERYYKLRMASQGRRTLFRLRGSFAPNSFKGDKVCFSVRYDENISVISDE